MPKIVRILAYKTRKGRSKGSRVKIDFDVGKSIVLSSEAVFSKGFKKGGYLKKEELDNLITEEAEGQLLNKVLRFIAIRPRSVKEVKEWFLRKDIDSKQTRRLLKKLIKKGILDDKKFAKWWIQQRIDFKSFSINRIKFELQRKGVDTSVFQEVISNMRLPKEEELARQLCKKKSWLWQKLPASQRKIRISQFLSRQGFSWETIRKVVDEKTSK